METMDSTPQGLTACVIVNTRSGSHDDTAISDVLDRHLAAAGITWTWVLRSKGQSRRKLTRQAIEDGHRLIVAAGGDGTVSKCADVVAEHPGVTLGILPTGTGNLLARELGLPVDLDAAGAIIAEGRTRTIDAMDVDGKRRCFSHVSMGTYSRIAALDTPDQKQRFGRLAYLGHLWSELRSARAWRFQIRHDDRRARSDASLILIANVGGVGIPGLRWGDDIAPDDGRLEVCVVKARTLLDYARLAGAGLLGRFEQTEAIEHLSASRAVRVTSDDRDLPVRGDGKTIGQGEVSITVVPGAVPVLVGE